MSDPATFIAHFNRAEALVWFAVAIGLPFAVRSTTIRQRIAVFSACIGFILFGITDLLEAERIGAIPAWLWASKIACGAILLSCRIIHVGWKNFRFTDRWLLFGLLCLATTVAMIMLG